MNALPELIDRIRAAAAAKQPLQIRAGGTKDFYGNPSRGDVLDPRGYGGHGDGIVAYEPTELAVTVRCGMPLAQLEAELDRKGQMLAFEPPHFGTAATVGAVWPRVSRARAAPPPARSVTTCSAQSSSTAAATC
jgi:glycolate oxidase FAD binding subunit